MGEQSPKPASTPTGAVFLSYASEDAEAAQRICATLRGAGIEVRAPWRYHPTAPKSQRSNYTPRRTRASARTGGRTLPLYAFRHETALPTPVFGPVHWPQGRQFLISADWRARLSTGPSEGPSRHSRKLGGNSAGRTPSSDLAPLALLT